MKSRIRDSEALLHEVKCKTLRARRVDGWSPSFDLEEFHKTAICIDDKTRVEYYAKIGTLVEATGIDYHKWLFGFLEKEVGQVAYYDIDFDIASKYRMYVAKDDISKPLYLLGAGSIEIIVPRGIYVADGEWGHTTLYRMEGYTTNRYTAVIYRDSSRYISKILGNDPCEQRIKPCPKKKSWFERCVKGEN